MWKKGPEIKPSRGGDKRFARGFFPSRATLRSGAAARRARCLEVGETGRPIGWQADGFAGRHLDDGEHLPGGDDERGGGGSANLEGAPKAEPVHAFEPAVDDEVVAEDGGFAVVDFGADDDGVNVGAGHFHEAHAELPGEEGAGDFDEAEVGDVVDDGGAVGVEKHDLHGDFELRSFRGGGVGSLVFHAPEKNSTFRRVNSTLAPENEARPETGRRAVLEKWGPALVIVAAALAYYWSYLGYWFNPHDEGGTVCLIAQRLMQGERPWADVALGYNAGWFYPLVGLFHLTGVNYLAARAFFFALSTLTALLGCGIVTRLGGGRWLGCAVGLVLVALPGSQFKNYIPLAEMANTACLIHLLHVEFSARRKWFGAVALGGAVLGLTALVRVEIAIFFAAIWALLLLFVLVDRRLALAQRAAHLLLGGALLAGVAGAVQVPPYLYLRRLGVEAHFAAQIPAWFGALSGGLQDQIGVLAQPGGSPAPTPEPVATKAATPPPVLDRSTLGRRPVADIWSKGSGKNRLLAVLTYAPFAGFGLFFAGGVLSLAARLWRRSFVLHEHSMQWLLLVGGSLTTFPQFFFFRPDRPHLSEFMPGYIVAMAGCLVLLKPPGQKRSRPQMLLAAAGAAFFAMHLAAFACYAFQHPSAGTIAARVGRETKFAAANGVRVRAFKREAQTLTTIRDAVLQHSRPEDFLVCYPYMPGYNLMTNRRTYVHNVYVDNATHDADWMANSIRDIAQRKPAVIIIDHRAINGTDASRFSRWAAPLYDCVKIHYARVAEIPSIDSSTIEVFARSLTPVAP